MERKLLSVFQLCRKNTWGFGANGKMDIGEMWPWLSFAFLFQISLLVPTTSCLFTWQEGTVILRTEECQSVCIPREDKVWTRRLKFQPRKDWEHLWALLVALMKPSTWPPMFPCRLIDSCNILIIIRTTTMIIVTDHRLQILGTSGILLFIV